MLFYWFSNCSVNLPSMEADLLNVADYAVEQPGVTGYICVDNEGLCLAAKGQARQSMSGIIHQLADLASKMEDPIHQNDSSKTKDPPVVRVDLERYKIMIQSRDKITTALITSQK